MFKKERKTLLLQIGCVCAQQSLTAWPGTRRWDTVLPIPQRPGPVGNCRNCVLRNVCRAVTPSARRRSSGALTPGQWSGAFQEKQSLRQKVRTGQSPPPGKTGGCG